MCALVAVGRHATGEHASAFLSYPAHVASDQQLGLVAATSREEFFIASRASWRSRSAPFTMAWMLARLVSTLKRWSASRRASACHWLSPAAACRAAFL
mmetsp:Transcript_8029/g.19848  ORF Transcript_8029/g.19848 Transcript_8029/m.19848 type:complete len:98 (-) Transcript_8029:382-675(-)